MDPEKFNEKIEKKVRNTIIEYNLIDPGDKIAVALSGGKDSVLTLQMLHRLQNDFDFEIFAISIDEGIGGYRENGIVLAEKFAQKLNVNFIKKSFKEELGFSLDDISDEYKSACIPCGVFRRYLLNKTAYDEGAVKIATGHNLDDEIQSFLMSFARADLIKFYKFGPKLDLIHPKLIPRIKPLWNVLEKEVGLWAVLNSIEVHFAECPYSSRSLRSKIKNFLNEFESKRPGTKISIINSFKKSFKFEKQHIILLECENCGEPSSANICKACEMIKNIKIDYNLK
ncbi:MAG: TIGR00269 family protein [Methanomicrobiales archaeon]